MGQEVGSYLNIKAVRVRRHEEIFASDDCRSPITLLGRRKWNGRMEEGKCVVTETGGSKGRGRKGTVGRVTGVVPTLQVLSNRPHLLVHSQMRSFAQMIPVSLVTALSRLGPGTL